MQHAAEIIHPRYAICTPSFHVYAHALLIFKNTLWDLESFLLFTRNHILENDGRSIVKPLTPSTFLIGSKREKRRAGAGRSENTCAYV